MPLHAFGAQTLTRQLPIANCCYYTRFGLRIQEYFPKSCDQPCLFFLGTGLQNPEKQPSPDCDERQFILSDPVRGSKAARKKGSGHEARQKEKPAWAVSRWAGSCRIIVLFPAPAPYTCHRKSPSGGWTAGRWGDAGTYPGTGADAVQLHHRKRRHRAADRHQIRHQQKHRTYRSNNRKRFIWMIK